MDKQDNGRDFFDKLASGNRVLEDGAKLNANGKGEETGRIPNYFLYGESAQPVWHETLHVEPIAKRSGANNWAISPHRHDVLLQILYIQRGGGEVLLDSARVPAVAPCVVFVPAQIVHGFAWTSDTDGYVITALQHALASAVDLLSPRIAPQIRRAHVIPVDASKVVNDRLLSLFLTLQEEYHERSIDYAACSTALLLTLVIHVFRLAAAAPQLPAGANNHRTLQVRLFRELIDLHFRMHRPVKDYADEIGITVATLGRLCQKQFGMSPMAVINARVVLEAKRELAHSSLSIKEIAHGLGFDDVGYFSRFFRNHTQLTPSEFRSAGW